MKNEISTVITALEKNNVKYEFFGETTSIRFYDGVVFKDNSNYSTDLGIKIADGIWAWFEVTFMSDGSTIYMFKQRYNQNIGATNKGMKMGWKCRDKVTKLIGVEH